MNSSVETYLLDGCGRCVLGGTPACKVHRWVAELKHLRLLVLDCGLIETSKWGVPCYTFKDANVLIVSAFKDYCAVSFFKGSLLADQKNLLEKPGENSQAVRLLKFTNTAQIKQIEADLKAYIFEAIEVEKAGLKVNFKKNPEALPQELEAAFEEDPMLKNAFEALTQGRQRGYILHFAQPKQAKTREARIAKCVPQILNGQGLHDGYKSMKK